MQRLHLGLRESQHESMRISRADDVRDTAKYFVDRSDTWTTNSECKHVIATWRTNLLAP